MSFNRFFFTDMTEYSDVIADHSTIEIRVSCKNSDKCNSICIFYEYETDRSEVIYDDENPSFFKTFKTQYIFESHQPLRFEIYNSKSDNFELENQNLIGYYETSVYDLVSNMSEIIEADLITANSNKFQITLKFHQTKTCDL